MKFQLKHQYASSGQTAFPAGQIEGIQAPARSYPIIGGILTLAGHAEAILHHDLEELLKNPTFRMLTPAEQEEQAKAEQAASQLQENTLATFTAQVQRVNGDGEAILTQQGEQAPSGNESDSQPSDDSTPPAVPEKKSKKADA